MKSGVVILACLILLVPLVISAAGVSPSYHEINFEPNLKGDYSFTFFFDEGAKVEFEVKGDLADYTKIVNKKSLGNGKTEVTVRLSLPEKIEVPGLHVLRVSGRDISGGDGGISLNLNVKGVLWIRVPYPAKYAEISLQTNLTNQGEELPYELTIYSRGEEDISVKPILELKSLDGAIIDEISLASKSIRSTEKEVYSGSLATDTYFPGDYYLNAVVEYDSGKTVNQTVLVRLGELKVKIINYTSTFEKEKLSRFEIDIESLWNNPLENVHAEVSVINYPLKSFSTPSITLEPWGKRKLSGVLDTHEISEETIQLKINVIYGEKTTSQIVNISLEKTTNWAGILIIAGVVIFLAVILFLIFYILKLKNGKEKK